MIIVIDSCRSQAGRIIAVGLNVVLDTTFRQGQKIGLLDERRFHERELEANLND